MLGRSEKSLLHVVISKCLLLLCAEICYQMTISLIGKRSTALWVSGTLCPVLWKMRVVCAWRCLNHLVTDCFAGAGIFATMFTACDMLYLKWRHNAFKSLTHCLPPLIETSRWRFPFKLGFSLFFVSVKTHKKALVWVNIALIVETTSICELGLHHIQPSMWTGFSVPNYLMPWIFRHSLS